MHIVNRKLKKLKQKLVDRNEREIFRWIDLMVADFELKLKVKYNDQVPKKGDAFDYEDYDDKENKENILQGDDETQASR